MPNYCQAPVESWAGYAKALNPLTMFRALLPECQPYTEPELAAMTAIQAAGVCASASDPAACQAGLIAAAAAVEEAAKATDPTGTCEYNASQDHPSLTTLLGPKVVCNLYAGKYTLYIIGGAALLGFMFVNRQGRY
jgi:hypothetical protein